MAHKQEEMEELVISTNCFSNLKSFRGASRAGYTLPYYLQAGKATLSPGAAPGRREGAESYTSPNTPGDFYPPLFLSGTATASFKKPQVHRYFPFLRLFRKISAGHSPKHFTSFGYYVKTLAKKKDV